MNTTSGTRGRVMRRRARSVVALAGVGALTMGMLASCSWPGRPTPPTPTPPGPTVAPPSGGGTQRVSSTIRVNGNFDGRGTRYVGTGSLGSGGDGEGKDPIFLLSPGATISNLTIGRPGSDGIHCTGTCTIRNVVWEDVLDDAATLKGSSPSDVMTIYGGSASNASDKVFQHNGPGKVVITGGFTVNGFGKLYRSCGNCRQQYKREVLIDNVNVNGPGGSLVGLNTRYGDRATIRNIRIRNGGFTLCELYDGNNSGRETVKDPPHNRAPFCTIDRSTISGG